VSRSATIIPVLAWNNANPYGRINGLSDRYGSRESKDPSYVTLHDGRRVDLRCGTEEELARWHWEEERHYAAEIMRHAAGSDERRDAIRVGYTVVNSILAASREGAVGEPRLGLSDRNTDLVFKVLRRTTGPGHAPGFFEVGFGFGELLEQLADRGYRVGGNEVAENCLDVARRRLGDRGRLFMGSLTELDLQEQKARWDVVYWNDVMEHIPPDEITEHLEVIHTLLAPGGTLVTVTPNWHVRPSDVTRRHRPPRSAPEGFHLREYTMREARDLFARGGFRDFYMPLVVLPKRTYLLGKGGVTAKLAVEPVLEHLPIRVARLLAGGLGYHCLMARAGPSC